jgi:4-oxalocrotonate tautomerase
MLAATFGSRSSLRSHPTLTLPLQAGEGMRSRNPQDARNSAIALAKVKNMPHIIVKLLPGKSEAQKQHLADRITQNVMDVFHYGEESVSVAFEEISSADWAEKVYRTDIQHPAGKLYKKPGYRM